MPVNLKATRHITQAQSNFINRDIAVSKTGKNTISENNAPVSEERSNLITVVLICKNFCTADSIQ